MASFAQVVSDPATRLQLMNKSTLVINDEINKFFQENWVERLTSCKRKAWFLSCSLERVFPEESKLIYRVRHCGDKVAYIHSEHHKKTRVEGYFCDHRLCPVCAWYKSRSLFGKIYRYVAADPNKTYVFITLTVPNVSGENLRDTVKLMNSSVGKMFHMTSEEYQKSVGGARSIFDKCFTGTIRRLEITYNIQTQQFHPHVHIIAECVPQYAPGTDYFLTKYELLERWRHYMKDDRITQVDIKQIKPDDTGSLAGAVAEVSKYPFKFEDELFYSWNREHLDNFVYWVSSLKRLRFESATGSILQALHFVQLADDQKSAEIPYADDAVMLQLDWRPGVRSYQLKFVSGDPYHIEYNYWREKVMWIDPSGYGSRASPK